MLRITLHDVDGPLLLKLEGRLAGEWVCELERCWRTSKANHPKRGCCVDLTGVTFIDHAGGDLLQLMHRDGIRLVASGLMLQDLVDHIKGRMD